MNQPPWQLLIISSVILFSISTILQKILLRGEKTDPIAFSLLFQFYVGIIIAIFAFAIGELHFPNLVNHVPNLLVMILFYGLGNIFLFKALQKIEASNFVIIFSSRALFTILASSIILFEGLNSIQFLGVGLVIGGILLVNLKSSKIQFGKYEFFALLAAMCFGLTTTNDRILLKSINLYPYVVLAFLIPALAVQVFYPKTIIQMKPLLQGKIFLKFSLLCCFYAGSAILFFAALQNSSNSSQVVSINLTSVVITVLLSIIFLKENKNLIRKIMASIISFVGLLILS